MGWDGIGINCCGMGWDRKICSVDKPGSRYRFPSTQNVDLERIFLLTPDENFLLRSATAKRKSAPTT